MKVNINYSIWVTDIRPTKLKKMVWFSCYPVPDSKLQPWFWHQHFILKMPRQYLQTSTGFRRLPVLTQGAF